MDWLVCFGCNTYTVGTIATLFKTYKETEDGHEVMMGDNHTSKVIGSGNVEIQFTSGKKLTLHNGVAERKNRFLQDMINVMLVNANLPKNLWGEALLTACHTRKKKKKNEEREKEDRKKGKDRKERRKKRIDREKKGRRKEKEERTEKRKERKRRKREIGIERRKILMLVGNLAVCSLISNRYLHGWIFNKLGGGLIVFIEVQENKTCITHSTMEAEFLSLAAAGKEVEWLRNMLLDIRVSVATANADVLYIVIVNSTHLRAYNKVYNGKSRHISLRHAYIKELISNRIITIEYIRSCKNLADPFTKGLLKDIVFGTTREMGLKPIE
ncbi:zinc finger, CCHC-type containing protein [Tanacetum coccineum]|uniref:Zinc finger, CCHC-type containing protein n=1 Tax=Tanacetum coccineum TaxID=301880 RepID=A0ABQ4XJL6_9ASTR